MNDLKPERSKAQLYAGVKYWSTVIVTLDKKLETLCENYGFGELGLTIQIHNGKISYTIYRDEIKIKEENGEK